MSTLFPKRIIETINHLKVDVSIVSLHFIINFLTCSFIYVSIVNKGPDYMVKKMNTIKNENLTTTAQFLFTLNGGIAYISLKRAIESSRWYFSKKGMRLDEFCGLAGGASFIQMAKSMFLLLWNKSLEKKGIFLLMTASLLISYLYLWVFSTITYDYSLPVRTETNVSAVFSMFNYTNTGVPSNEMYAMWFREYTTTGENGQHTYKLPSAIDEPTSLYMPVVMVGLTEKKELTLVPKENVRNLLKLDNVLTASSGFICNINNTMPETNFDYQNQTFANIGSAGNLTTNISVKHIGDNQSFIYIEHSANHNMSSPDIAERNIISDTFVYGCYTYIEWGYRNVTYDYITGTIVGLTKSIPATTYPDSSQLIGDSYINYHINSPISSRRNTRLFAASVYTEGYFFNNEFDARNIIMKETSGLIQWLLSGNLERKSFYSERSYIRLYADEKTLMRYFIINLFLILSCTIVSIGSRFLVKLNGIDTHEASILEHMTPNPVFSSGNNMTDKELRKHLSNKIVTLKDNELIVNNIDQIRDKQMDMVEEIPVTRI